MSNVTTKVSMNNTKAELLDIIGYYQDALKLSQGDLEQADVYIKELKGDMEYASSEADSVEKAYIKAVNEVTTLRNKLKIIELLLK